MSAKPVFARDGSIDAGIRRRIGATKPVFVFLDYDGTVSPIRRRPGEAVLSRAMASLLAQLGRHPRVRLGVVTGRSLADITRIAPEPWHFIAANHGLEIRRGRTLWAHPEAKRVMPMLDRAARRLRAALRGIPGAAVEHKGYSLTVHYRRVRSADAARIEAIVRREVEPWLPSLRIGHGKKVWEVKPGVSWTKGDAVLRLLDALDRTGNAAIIYAGDDTTDEDAFRLLPARAVTVKVGKDAATRARYRVRTVSDIKKFLFRLLLSC